jgi:hypothetical protein
MNILLNVKYSSINIQRGVDLSVLDFREGEQLTTTQVETK